MLVPQKVPSNVEPKPAPTKASSTIALQSLYSRSESHYKELCSRSTVPRNEYRTQAERGFDEATIGLSAGREQSTVPPNEYSTAGEAPSSSAGGNPAERKTYVEGSLALALLEDELFGPEEGSPCRNPHRSRSRIRSLRAQHGSLPRSRSTSTERRTSVASQSRSRSRGSETRPVEREVEQAQTHSHVHDLRAVGRPPSDLQPGLCSCRMGCYHHMESGHLPFCLYCDPVHCPEGCCCPRAMCYPDTDSTRPQDLHIAIHSDWSSHTSPSPSVTSSSPFTHRIARQSEIDPSSMQLEPRLGRKQPWRWHARASARLVNIMEKVQGLASPLGPPLAFAPPETSITNDMRAITSGEDASKGLNTASCSFPSPFAHVSSGTLLGIWRRLLTMFQSCNNR